MQIFHLVLGKKLFCFQVVPLSGSNCVFLFQNIFISAAGEQVVFATKTDWCCVSYTENVNLKKVLSLSLHIRCTQGKVKAHNVELCRISSCLVIVMNTF